MRAGAEPRHDASMIIGMQTRGAFVVAAIFLSGYLLITLGTLSPGDPLWELLVAFALVVAGFLILLLVPGDPLPLGWSMVLTSMSPLVFATILPPLPVPMGNSLQLGPPLGGTVVICFFMCVRGRVGLAWLGLVLSIVVLTIWGAATGQGVVYGVTVSLGNVAVMVMATLFAVLLRPAAADIYALRAQAQRQVAIRSAGEAASAERDAQLRRLDELARPTLERVAAQRPLTAEELARTALIEARLRDGIRARGLDLPVVTAAAWAARARGVRVTLLDDGGLEQSGDLGEVVRQRLAVAVAELVDDAVDGEVTVRIQPPGRDHLATVIVESAGRMRRHTYGAGAAPATF